MGLFSDITDAIIDVGTLGYDIYSDQRDYSSEQYWNQMDYDLTKEYNEKNYQLQSDQLYNGYSIAASDMASAGLNPVLAAGSSATTGSASGNSASSKSGSINTLNPAASAIMQARQAAETRESNEKIAAANNANQLTIAQIKSKDEANRAYVDLMKNRESIKSQESEWSKKHNEWANEFWLAHERALTERDKANQLIKQQEEQIKDLQETRESRVAEANAAAGKSNEEARAQKRINDFMDSQGLGTEAKSDAGKIIQDLLSFFGYSPEGERSAEKAFSSVRTNSGEKPVGGAASSGGSSTGEYKSFDQWSKEMEGTPGWSKINPSMRRQMYNSIIKADKQMRSKRHGASGTW